MGILINTSLSVLLVLVFISYFRSYSKLSHIPGPTLAKYTQLWLVRNHLSGRNHEILANVSAKYGSLARIGPNELITNDPELVRRMNAPRSGYIKSDQYTAARLEPGRDNIISVRDEHHHSELRRKMAIGYSGRDVEGLEDYVHDSIRDLLELIEKKYISTALEYKPMDFGVIASYFTLDVISAIAFGEAWGDLRTHSDQHNWLKELRNVLPGLTAMMLLPGVYDFLDTTGLLRLLGPKPTDKSGFGKILGLAKSTASQRFGPEAKVKKDMLGSFVANGLTQHEAEAETMIQILAGSDTTSTAIRTFMLYVTSSPKTYTALQQEVDSALSQDLISSPITTLEAHKLPYLQACIKESLRMLPPVVSLQSREVPKGGDTINGIHVPAGTNIGYSVISLHRNEAILGPDASLFRPERWIEASPERLAAMERNNNLIFSHGRFQCLGKNIALMELNIVFVELLKRYNFAIVYPEKPWRSLAYDQFTQDEFWLRVSRRERQSEWKRACLE